MRVTFLARSWFGLGTLLVAAACGGGGGGAVAPASPTSLGLFEAQLLGTSETAVVDAGARATALLELRSDGQLSFASTGQAAWVPSVSGLHIHSGAAGVNGAIVVDLLSDGAAFDGATRTASDTFSISAALAAQIAATPSAFYVNVHTTGAGAAGRARGQLAPYTPADWHTVLSAAQEIPTNPTGAHGAASLRVAADRTLSWVVALTTPAVTQVTDAHVHVGNAATASGAILVNLASPSATVDATAGTLTYSVPIALDALARIAFDPSSFYVNVHSSAYPGGLARGQLDAGTVEMWAPLRGDQEPAPAPNPAARGGVTLELESGTAGRAILAVPVSQAIAGVTQARVYPGGLGATSATVLVDLMGGPDYQAGPLTGSAEGSVAYTQAAYARLLAAPGSFYVNFHTAAAPSGIVRGQLTQAPETLVGTLTGAAVVPSATLGNSGRVKLLLDGVHACSFTIDMTSPTAGALVGAYLDDGAAGLNGPILIDLLGGPHQVNGSKLTGSATFTGRTAARLLANAPAFYGYVSTAAELSGAARGQMLLLTDDTPPAGLVYSTPTAVYVTGTAITPNVPDSIGGPVASYAVAPTLPAGLTLDTGTGIISGTPTATAAAQNYVVTASNASGNGQATVNITVNVGAPTNLVYTTPVIYIQGTAITPNSPTNSGGAISSYGVSPSLPAGLSLSTSTGVISGTPTGSSAATNYTVTGTNATSSTQATVNIRVDASLQAPTGLTYSTPSPSYPTGYAITTNTPSAGGGPIDSYAVSPSLPAGLTLDTTTGQITGTPTTVSASAGYTVTATNGAGSAQVTLNIAVTLGAPTGLSYDNVYPLGYVSGGTFPTCTPSSSGGAVASYSISPTTLPSGLTFSTSTGVIGGSPTVTSAQTTYTVTATNATGSAFTYVYITVLQ